MDSEILTILQEISTTDFTKLSSNFQSLLASKIFTRLPKEFIIFLLKIIASFEKDLPEYANAVIFKFQRIEEYACNLNYLKPQIPQPIKPGPNHQTNQSQSIKTIIVPPNGVIY